LQLPQKGTSSFISKIYCEKKRAIFHYRKFHDNTDVRSEFVEVLDDRLLKSNSEKRPRVFTEPGQIVEAKIHSDKRAKEGREDA